MGPGRSGGHAVWVVAASVLVAVASCSSPSKTTVTVSGAQAYAATTRARSAAIDMTTEVIDAKGRTSSEGSATGTYSWATRQGSFVAKIGPISGYHLITDEIIDGATTYTRPSATGTPPGGLRADLPSGWSEETWTTPIAPGLLDLLLAVIVPGGEGNTEVDDPAAVLAQVLSAATHVTGLGRQTIDGSVTTHYRAAVPMSTLDPGGTAVPLFGTGPVPVDYWLDGSDQLRLLHMTLTMKAPPARPGTVATTTSTTLAGDLGSRGSAGATAAPALDFPIHLVFADRISDYGVAVHLTIPPPSQIGSQATCSARGDGSSCYSSTSQATAPGR